MTARRTARHAARPSVRDSFLPLRVTAPIMIVGTVLSVSLTTVADTVPLAGFSTSVKTVEAPSEARSFPFPGYWVTKVMCMGPLRGTIFCGARGPAA